MTQKVERNNMNPSLEQRTKNLSTTSMKVNSQGKKLERIKAKAMGITQVSVIHSEQVGLEMGGNY